jgi:signal-transduction protein with cAMP-binding, CBS, and nucleotidyltransferase domain
MFVERLLPAARARLVIISDDAPLIEAARLLRSGTDLVVACRSAVLTGVVTRTDIVAQICGCQGASCLTAVSVLMTRDPVLCRQGDLLHDVWERMKSKRLRNIPVIDQESRPIGVFKARDIFEVLLKESEDEESMLRDYVMGVGYLN